MSWGGHSAEGWKSTGRLGVIDQWHCVVGGLCRSQQMLDTKADHGQFATRNPLEIVLATYSPTCSLTWWKKLWWKWHLPKTDSCWGQTEQVQPDCKTLGEKMARKPAKLLLSAKNKFIPCSASEKKWCEVLCLHLINHWPDLLGEGWSFVLLFPLTALRAACCARSWPSLAGAVCLRLCCHMAVSCSELPSAYGAP